jgi:hypothetical protein
LKNDVNVAPKSNKQKNGRKKILKIIDENSRIRIRLSEGQIPRSGSIPKCHRSGTLPAGHMLSSLSNIVAMPDSSVTLGRALGATKKI